MIFEKDLLKMQSNDLIELQNSIKDILRERKDLEIEKLVRQFFDLREKLSSLGVMGIIEFEYTDINGEYETETADIFYPNTEISIEKNSYY